MPPNGWRRIARPRASRQHLHGLRLLLVVYAWPLVVDAQPQPSASVGPCASLPSPVTSCRPSAPAVASRRRVPSVVAVSRSASRAAAAGDNLRTVRTFEPPRAAAHRVPLGPVSPECRAAGGHRWPVARAGVRPFAPAPLQSARPCACWRCGECVILSVLLTRK